MTDEQYKIFLRYRNIHKRDTICKKCNGSGVRLYANTSTWMGGMGGSMMTSDVCDGCWGSGKANEKGANLKILQRMYKENKDLKEKIKELEDHIQIHIDTRT